MYIIFKLKVLSVTKLFNLCDFSILLMSDTCMLLDVNSIINIKKTDYFEIHRKIYCY